MVPGARAEKHQFSGCKKYCLYHSYFVCCSRPKLHLQYLSVIHATWFCWMEERLPVHHSWTSVCEEGIFSRQFEAVCNSFLAWKQSNKTGPPEGSVLPILYHDSTSQVKRSTAFPLLLSVTLLRNVFGKWCRQKEKPMGRIGKLSSYCLPAS